MRPALVCLMVIALLVVSCIDAGESSDRCECVLVETDLRESLEHIDNKLCKVCNYTYYITCDGENYVLYRDLVFRLEEYNADPNCIKPPANKNATIMVGENTLAKAKRIE